MPNALTNTNISATYKGVLHTNGITIPPSGQETVYDGVGAQSSLSLGRTNQGATVSGSLSATDVYAGQLRMPKADNGIQNQVVARTVAGVLELKSLSEIIGGSTIANGVYDNPRITVVGGVITKIESRPTITLLASRVNLIPYADRSIQTNTLNFNINWTEQTGYYAGVDIPARHAIITVKMYLQSGSINLETRLLKDSVEIAQGTIGSNDTDNYLYLDNNRYIYVNQLIVDIPTSKTSLFQYITNLTKIQPVGSRLNQAGFGVTLDGWVF